MVTFIKPDLIYNNNQSEMQTKRVAICSALVITSRCQRWWSCCEHAQELLEVATLLLLLEVKSAAQLLEMEAVAQALRSRPWCDRESQTRIQQLHDEKHKNRD
jgi:hypothetical protein